MVKLDTSDPRLQKLGFRIFRPPIQLRNYIQSFWIICRKWRICDEKICEASGHGA